MSPETIAALITGSVGLGVGGTNASLSGFNNRFNRNLALMNYNNQVQAMYHGSEIRANDLVNAGLSPTLISGGSAGFQNVSSPTLNNSLIDTNDITNIGMAYRQARLLYAQEQNTEFDTDLLAVKKDLTSKQIEEVDAKVEDLKASVRYKDSQVKLNNALTENTDEQTKRLEIENFKNQIEKELIEQMPDKYKKKIQAEWKKSDLENKLLVAKTVSEYSDICDTWVRNILEVCYKFVPKGNVIGIGR